MKQPPLIAVLDACVLAGLFKRNLLLSCAEAGLFRPAWSATLLAETVYAGRRIHAASSNDVAWDEIDRQISAMQSAFPDALTRDVENRQNLARALPDANDRHVVSAALAAKASLIVTDNISDFPRKTMKDFSLEILTADNFFGTYPRRRKRRCAGGHRSAAASIGHHADINRWVSISGRCDHAHEAGRSKKDRSFADQAFLVQVRQTGTLVLTPRWLLSNGGDRHAHQNHAC